MSYPEPSCYSRSTVQLETPAPAARRTFDSDSRQDLHYLGTMVHSEPIIERCIGAITSGTLMKGITVMSKDGARMATKSFHNFVNKYYLHFARDAVRMFFITGFVVWHVARRQIKGSTQLIPEVLPLGTFTWTVKTRDKQRKRKIDDPLLWYDIQLQGVECDYHVFDFVKPDMTMQCVSALSSVIPLYIRLQVTRAAKTRCEEWNASVLMAVENSEKLQSNQMADEGAALNTKALNPHFDTLYEDTLAESTESRAAVAREQAANAKLPSNTHIFVLPKNHSVRGLDRVDTPQGMPESELEFQREVCYAMGVPVSLVMQLFQVGPSGTATGTTNDAATHSTQMLRNTCTLVAESLCELLTDVYDVAYRTDDPEQNGAAGSSEAGSKKKRSEDVTFEINCTPVLSIFDIVELHFREFVEDDAIDSMLMSCVGYPLNRKAERLPWNKTVQPPAKTEEDQVTRKDMKKQSNLQ
eukprot:1652420-Rhodomonas_salina.2